jgi:hypothetical protein
MAGKTVGLEDLSVAFVMEPVAAADWLIAAPVVFCLLVWFGAVDAAQAHRSSTADRHSGAARSCVQ